ncbi:GNAT family N-acetyltransferase [Jannaschia formosa]|uniref:GNAT family N-acetyltransferase n=1 Tax=Jannaschia formosa TaxID=2259592 RepID=UPI000E1B9150|nr:GNAT family N-acetyltransferase [Jannaschia formosa]TFL18706.1 N-acetyltransferase [Jannaschia formosa]
MTGTAVHIPTLVTGRLVLRAHRLADFEAYAATMASPRARMMTADPSRRAAWAGFMQDVASWCLHGFGLWAVELRDGTPVGQVGVNRPDHFPEPELGWLLHDGHEGKGDATEAATAALDWARGRVASLVSYVTPGNLRSEAVARRLGATPDPDAPLPEGETRAETTVWRHGGPA